MRPTLAFLTDFGTRDHYVGAMKGAALTVCPEAALVDITHEIAPQDILGGALELAAAAPYFPPGTVFVAVVDPGVGSARRALAASAGAYLFVAPDNGLLTGVFRDMPPAAVVEMTNATYARPRVSRTFEGRDRFAPAGAWLACGTPLEALGARLERWEMLEIPEPQTSSDAIQGVVLRVDRFGNLVTNIERERLDAFAARGELRVRVGSHVTSLVETYAEAGDQDVCALIGSSDRLEIAVNGASAAQRLGSGRGTAVVVTRT